MHRRAHAILAAVLALAILATMPVMAIGDVADVVGTVIDAHTELPLEGVRVRAWRASEAWEGDLSSPVAETLTSVEGTYALHALPDDDLIFAFIDESGLYRDVTAPMRGLPPTEAFAYPSRDTTLTLNAYLWDLQSVADQRTYRIGGSDRYQTAIAIARSNWGSASDVIIASGADFPDALAAAPLGGALDAPVLLTRKGSLPTGVIDEIRRLGATKVTIVGGAGAVSAAVEDQLSTAGIGVVSRIAGADRYSTAAAVAARVSYLNEAEGIYPPGTFVCRGDAYPDALAASPFAFTHRIPILLTRSTALPVASATQWHERSKTADGIYVVGGVGAVSDGVLQDLADTSATGEISYARFAGANRYATAADLVSSWRPLFDTMGLATGQSFPDALAGGAACGRWAAALLLTPSDSLSGAAASVLKNTGPYVVDMQAFGGAAALSDATVLAADAAMGTSLYDIDDPDNRITISKGPITATGISFSEQLWPAARIEDRSPRAPVSHNDWVPSTPDRQLTTLHAGK